MVFKDLRDTDHNSRWGASERFRVHNAALWNRMDISSYCHSHFANQEPRHPFRKLTES